MIDIGLYIDLKFSQFRTFVSIPGDRQVIHLFLFMDSYDYSSYIRSVYKQCHMVLFKSTEQNISNQTLTQVSQLYAHVFFCLKVIRSLLNLPTGGYDL